MTIVAWALRYLIVSVGSLGQELPWTRNGTNSTQYWEDEILDSSDGFEDGIGGMNWYNFGLLTACWVLMFLTLFKGIKIQAYIAHVCVVLPYGFLLALLVRNLTTKGVIDGVNYFIVPDWNQLLDPKVWSN